MQAGPLVDAPGLGRYAAPRMTVTPSDPPLQQVRAAGGLLSFTDRGSGSVIAFVHGLPGSGRDYRYLGGALEARARVVRLDMPGFGGTPRESAEGLTVDARAAFVVGALDALGIEQCIVVGHSMGGPVALAAAARSPDRIVGLALLASVGARPHRLLRRMPLRAWIGRAIDLPIVGPVAHRVATLGFRSSGFPASTPASDVAQTMRILSAFEFPPIERALETLRVPTLTAFADDDPFIEPEIQEELAARVPLGPRLRWAAGGHNVQKSHAREVADALVSMF